jgi:hypothetical protein
MSNGEVLSEIFGGRRVLAENFGGRRLNSKVAGTSTVK